MSSRARDTSDFDLERFVDLFDAAISSDNPAVQRALKNLLLIASLVDSDVKPEERVRGPLRRLVDDLQNLNRRIGQLEQNDIQRRNYTPGVINTPWITNPSMPTTAPRPYITTQPNTGNPNWPPGTIIGGAIGASSTAYDDQFTVGGYEEFSTKKELKDYD